MGKGTGDWGLVTGDSGLGRPYFNMHGSQPRLASLASPSKGRGENVRVRSKRLVIESVAEKSFLQTDKERARKQKTAATKRHFCIGACVTSP